MFDDLPPDLDRLRTLRTWHALWVARIDTKIAAVQQRQAEAEHGRRNRPQLLPDWLVELGIGTGHQPLQLHAGNCYLAGKRRRAVSRDEARRLIATGLRACSHCRPDTQLDIPGLPPPRPPADTRMPPERPSRLSPLSCRPGACA